MEMPVKLNEIYETTRQVLEKILDHAGQEEEAGSPNTTGGSETSAPEKTPGHGRHSAAEYGGAEKIRVPHESLKPGDPCPHCHQGTVYESVEPGHLVRIRGQAPLGATV